MEEKHLIDRDLLLENINAETVTDSHTAKWLVLDQPLYKRPQGHWTREYDESMPIFLKDGFFCSVCNGRQTYGVTKFCLHCGAEMSEPTIEIGYDKK